MEIWPRQWVWGGGVGGEEVEVEFRTQWLLSQSVVRIPEL